MLPLKHFLASIIVLGFLFPFYKLWGLAFLIGSFFIDVDHYLWYIIRHRNFSLKNAYFYHKERPRRERDMLHIFHVWEFWVLMFVLAFFNNFFALIFLGLVFHLILDFIDLYFNIDTIYNRAFSFFAWLQRH